MEGPVEISGTIVEIGVKVEKIKDCVVETSGIAEGLVIDFGCIAANIGGIVVDIGGKNTSSSIILP